MEDKGPDDKADDQCVSHAELREMLQEIKEMFAKHYAMIENSLERLDQ